ncbi:MAG: hypothetical protein KAS99_06670, partial [Candidatus Omnitrophica bacterium]|nr:hypothetical protein [Candidatus Omnitrophota bacterium]
MKSSKLIIGLIFLVFLCNTFDNVFAQEFLKDRRKATMPRSSFFESKEDFSAENDGEVFDSDKTLNPLPKLDSKFSPSINESREYLANLLGIDIDDIEFVSAEYTQQMTAGDKPGIIGYVAGPLNVSIKLELTNGDEYIVKASNGPTPEDGWTNFEIVGKVRYTPPESPLYHGEQLKSAATAYLANVLGIAEEDIEFVEYIEVGLMWDEGGGIIGHDGDGTAAFIQLQVKGETYVVRAYKHSYPEGLWGNFRLEGRLVERDMGAPRPPEVDPPLAENAKRLYLL